MCWKDIWGFTFWDGESRRPLWSQYVKANAAVAVDIWVVDSCGECNLREGVESEWAGHNRKQNEETTEKGEREKGRSLFCVVCHISRSAEGERVALRPRAVLPLAV